MKANANAAEAQSDMALVLSEIKANGSRLDVKTNRLEGIAGSVHDLKNRGRRKNLRIVCLPGVEGYGSLVLFLRSSIPKWLDSPTLDIKRAYRYPPFAPSNLNSSRRSILVSFLRFTKKEIVLRAALKKRGASVLFRFIYQYTAESARV